MSTTPIERLVATMAALRDPDNGCPWDLKQDHGSLIPYLLEETYEVIEALEQGNDRAFCEELGDLLMQIVFHARIAEEQQRFDFDAVADAIDSKLIRRHPHVFGDSRISDEAELEEAWQQSKAAEKGLVPNDKRLLDEVPKALPALMRAQKLQRKAARTGFDWPDHSGPLAKIREETREIEEALQSESSKEALTDEVGDLLFSVVNLARHLDIDAEEALRRGNEKFRRRFSDVEQKVKTAGKALQEMSASELDQLWNTVKTEE